MSIFSAPFVLFDTDHGTVDAETLHHNADAEVDAFRVFCHTAMIRGEVRLAFAAVDHQHVDRLLLWRREFDVRWEGSTPETDHPGILNGLHHLLGRQILPARDDPRPERLR
jgi:hypothetical protein